MKKRITILFASLGTLVFTFLSTAALSFEFITETETVIVQDVVVEIVKTADNFILLFDSSSSMDEPYKNTGMKKIGALKKVLKERNNNFPDLQYNAGLYTFSPRDNVLRNRTLKPYYEMKPYNKAEFAKAIDALPDDGAGPTMLQDALTELDEILAAQKGSTVIFVITDGKFTKVRNMKNPVKIANDLAAKYNISFFVVSNASSKIEKDILKAVGSINAYSRMIPLDYLLTSPANLTGALFVLEENIVERAINIEKIVGIVLSPPGVAAPPLAEADINTLAAELKDIRFDFNKSDIKPEYYDSLDMLGKFMQVDSQNMVIFSGFTDSAGDPEYNLGLSRQRAESVGMYLVERFGIDPERIVLHWYGEASPVAGNDTFEGRSQNRRVETVVAELP